MAGKTTMTLGEATRISLSSLWAHKMRSMLTLLGVVIGVMSVIAVVSIVNGLNSYVSEKVFNLGTDVFLINRGPSIITNIEDYEKSQKRRKFYMEDYQAVRDECRGCDEVGASINQSVGQVKYGTNYLSDSTILGWTPSMPRLYDIVLAGGRHINQNDVDRAAPFCTIGADIADNLFPSMDPIGKEIRIDAITCQVIGIGAKRGSVLGQSRDN